MTERFDKRVQKIEWVPVQQISVIWAQSQREFNEKHAKTIADNFDPEMFGTLSVTLPNGKGVYHVIDGQHRRAAVEMLYGPGEKVPCEIFEAEDPARAATLFKNINNARRPLQPLEKFKVAVTAGDRDETAVKKIIEANGYVIKGGGGKGNPNPEAISCTGALLSVYRVHGEETLDNTLKVIRGTWGLDRGANSAIIVRGYGEFMAEYRKKVSWKRLAEVISKKYTPGRFLGAVKTAHEMSGGSVASAVKGLLLANYNRGLRQSQAVAEKK